MIENRKEEHINIAETMNVTSAHTFWDDIRLIHKALPDIDYDLLDTKITFLGTQFDFPFLISSMTGGTEKAKKIL